MVLKKLPKIGGYVSLMSVRFEKIEIFKQISYKKVAENDTPRTKLP